MSTSVRTVQQLAARAAQDPQLAADLGADPVRELNRIAAQTQLPDTWIYRLVVIALGSAVLISLIGGIILAKVDGGNTANVLPLLTAIGSAAVGALAGLLAPSPSATA
jgi:uncharacterized protein YcfJ